MDSNAALAARHQRRCGVDWRTSLRRRASLLIPADGRASAMKHFDTLASRLQNSRSNYAMASRPNCRLPTNATSMRPSGDSSRRPYTKIMADAGNVAWDMGSYGWLLTGKDFATIHPSLQRQAVLNMAYGLYEVVPGRIYQVRGYDLANISFIRATPAGSSSIR